MTHIYSTTKYEIIVNEWNMDTVELINIFHAQNVSSEFADRMVELLELKFPVTEDFEITVLKTESKVSTLQL